MNYLDSFSVRLKSLRKAMNLTQPAVAEVVGVTKQSINDLEHARVNPSVPTLIALADLFDCSIDYLVGRSDEPERR